MQHFQADCMVRFGMPGATMLSTSALSIMSHPQMHDEGEARSPSKGRTLGPGNSEAHDTRWLRACEILAIDGARAENVWSLTSQALDSDFGSA